MRKVSGIYSAENAVRNFYIHTAINRGPNDTPWCERLWKENGFMLTTKDITVVDEAKFMLFLMRWS